MVTSVDFAKRPVSQAKIYGYTLDDGDHKDLIKIGYTTRDVRVRVKEQTETPLLKPRIVIEEDAMRNDGTSFEDHDVHRVLLANHVVCVGGEWYRCSVEDAQKAIEAVRNREDSLIQRMQDFKMRPEQKEAVLRTKSYFDSFKKENPGQAPRFLWNAKMRFGKTFTSYELAKAEGYKKILVLTFKPAVENSWREDLESHKDFEGWQFIANDTELTYESADRDKPIVYFGSLQDFLGRSKSGGIKLKNEWAHTINWDLVIFDEYHFGAWNEKTKKLFDEDESEGDWEQDSEQDSVSKLFEDTLAENGNENFLPITSGAYLYLSGTPFRAISNGEFIEDQIFNWTYSDEQRAKRDWNRADGDNPYETLPQMVLMTYQVPESISEIAAKGEFNEFDLNEFFKATGNEDNATFVHENDVQKWLDLIRGSYLETAIDDLAMGARKPPLPYSDSRLKNILSHTLWFLPTVASCYAMNNLLKQHQNVFYHDYAVNVAAGSKAGQGVKALEPVLKSFGNPLETKTITLSCGKLTTGVTIKPWTGIFMLRNLNSPETYFQAAFRVQSPWTIANPDDEHPNEIAILKKECYVFDFAPNRALRQIADYSCKLDPNNGVSPEQSVSDFINFLPVLAYDGSSMKQLNAADVLDIATAGTSSTLLAKRWESALLVNVDNNTLQRLMNNQQAMDALMKIEGFRSLNEDVETIINKSEKVSAKKKSLGDNVSAKQKKELSEEEKEYKSKRKQIQEKLIKFATRIPIFMYLTDFREHTLADVITKLEPELFKKVTGLTKDDFRLLVSLNLFNGERMNDAVYKFKRYEDASLSYAGINKHPEDERVGLFDTSITRQEFEEVQ
ncbi:DEAD/DEAH box helicase family protein [Bifidobacterium sp. ESL0784]|uniref:GIY-YIG nuclease family protein n=1 Tax=Bifidobacterium sp. ESL0784 TaxID=2983231 RepID=UPI0023F97032|nr:GIY-YIG nuclease family protein [Bifidobacterium sp. ESL0784]MDF7641315.1 DEAD/DEAH box helicase family protein [Bifidobacterium sp. ESL0784]